MECLYKACEVVSLPCRKNETDGEFAIRHVHSMGYKNIDVYGVIGGRLDHFMIIYKLLQFSDIKFRIMDSQNCIYALEKGVYDLKKNSTYISIFPCEECILTLTGVEYPLYNTLVNEICCSSYW